MISAYVVILSVIGLVLSYLWLIHNLWLQHIFSENAEAKVGLIKRQDTDLLSRGVTKQIIKTGSTRMFVLPAKQGFGLPK